MQYALLIYGNEQDFANATPEERDVMNGEHLTLARTLVQKGQMRGGEQLHPTSMATTVRTSNGNAQITDGPFAETVEHLGGFYIIDVADLDEAISYARTINGTVEIRPVVLMPARS